MTPVGANSASRSRSPIRRKMSKSPVRAYSPPRSKSPTRRRSPHRRRSPVRSKSPVQARKSMRSPIRTKALVQTRSPLRSRSPESWSPSPHTKRLRRAQETRELDRTKDRERDRSSVKNYERDKHKDKDKDLRRDGTWESRGRDKYVEASFRSQHSHSISPKDRKQRRRHESQSPPQRSIDHGSEKARSPKAGARDEAPDRRAREMPESEIESLDALAKMNATEEALKSKQNEKNKPSFELSGKLAAETNKVRGITLLFNEPPDARKPNLRWRLYVFKGGEALNEPLYIHRQTCYLFGRERRVADIPTDHPSCSKQHAVIQFRQIEKEELDGTVSKHVRPYLMDLGSTNGTHLNDNRLEPQRYYELFEKDTIKFGNSSREYVILHENSAG
ncbi:hypothetical protein SUGI_0423360 [Cryptomeria japonica]|nr:FHA domain-containing protein DDL isoform X2 [Cryptomeria japonica]XP_057850572.1 FHA domain-containing protein DDL isoform X2 [Cryptomeria japonica]XP_057850573.1 FHA domain-containing protein DDL isoform X2 [Cryptomeria japonica]GLJ22484.1 hypothetical protein SUGI_0423360 [Cryptomeria japonica]